PLLEKMLQPNPADRPDSMATVAAWRPGPEVQPPPPRRAAPTRDRSQEAARPAPAAKSKPMLGRRLTKAALVLMLLLVVAGGGFYLAQDVILRQVKVEYNSPPLPVPQPDVPRPPAPPSTDLRTRITEFLDIYPGGDCFLVGHLTVKDDDVH